MTLSLASPQPAAPEPIREPPVLCRHCELPLLQVAVPDGPQPVRLHSDSLQAPCAAPRRTTAYPAPMSLVDGVWMTERQAREMRGLPCDPLETPRVLPAEEIVLPLPRLLQLPSRRRTPA